MHNSRPYNKEGVPLLFFKSIPYIYKLMKLVVQNWKNTGNGGRGFESLLIFVGLKGAKMENTFPCKDCIIKMVCREQCDKVVPYARVIHMYITLYATCPDCGNNLNDNGFINKRVALCFDCNAGFQQMTMVKPTIDQLRLLQFPLFAKPRGFTVSSSRIQIITDLRDLKAKEKTAEVPTMEETHDVIFDRMSRDESFYAIRSHKIKTSHNIIKEHPNPLKKKSNKPKMKMPPWTKHFKAVPIGFSEDDEPMEDSPGIII